MVEKAKTTPDAYPMTVNAIVTGSNQKSNRDPITNFTADDVEQILEELRGLGAVAEVQGAGRAAKYRHYAYDWLGVDKVEAAVMTELLLRGEQTLGELRARASRMEPIADLAALKTVVDSLLKKNLMVELTLAGRGQVVSHNLYKQREIDEIRAQFASGAARLGSEESDEESSPHGAAPPRPLGAKSGPTSGMVTTDMFAEHEVAIAELRAEVARLRIELDELKNR